MQNSCIKLGLQGGSIGRALDSIFSDPRFEPQQEHKKKTVSFSESKMLCRLAVGCAQPLCVYARMRIITYARLRSCSPCQNSVDYGNTKRPSMHFTDRRIKMYFCTVNVNSRVMICTLIKFRQLAAGFKKPSAMQRFESIWKLRLR